MEVEGDFPMEVEGDFPMEEGVEQKPIFEERLKDLVWGFGEFEELEWRTISINLFLKKSLTKKHFLIFLLRLLALGFRVRMDFGNFFGGVLRKELCLG